MVKILSVPENYKVVCNKCGCLYVYDLVDIEKDYYGEYYTTCPNCGRHVTHYIQSNILLEENPVVCLDCSLAETGVKSEPKKD